MGDAYSIFGSRRRHWNEWLLSQGDFIPRFNVLNPPIRPGIRRGTNSLCFGDDDAWLFRRRWFNTNGFILQPRGWKLSPAYDMNPPPFPGDYRSQLTIATILSILSLRCRLPSISGFPRMKQGKRCSKSTSLLQGGKSSPRISIFLRANKKKWPVRFNTGFDLSAWSDDCWIAEHLVCIEFEEWWMKKLTKAEPVPAHYECIFYKACSSLHYYSIFIIHFSQ